MKVKEESEKPGLKLNIQKTKIMASGPITSWQIDGETMADFIFLGFKITADGDCSQETCIRVKKQQLEPDMKRWTGSKLGKEYVKAVYCQPAYLIYAEYIMWNARLDEAQAGIKIAERNSMQMTPPLWQRAN